MFILYLLQLSTNFLLSCTEPISIFYSPFFLPSFFLFSFASCSTVIMQLGAEGPSTHCQQTLFPCRYSLRPLFSPCLNFVACWKDNGRNRSGEPLRVSNFFRRVRVHTVSSYIPLTLSEIDGFRSFHLSPSFFFFSFPFFFFLLTANTARELNSKPTIRTTRNKRLQGRTT